MQSAIMPLLILFTVLLSAAHQASAESSELTTIMAPAGDRYEHLTTQPATTSRAGVDCAALAAEIRALKGKPQRRQVAAQRYEAECRR